MMVRRMNTEKTTIDVPRMLFPGWESPAIEVEAQLYFIRGWLSRPEIKRQLKEATTELGIQLALRIAADSELVLPNSPEERQAGFGRWLLKHQKRHDPLISQLITIIINKFQPIATLEDSAHAVAVRLLTTQLRRDARSQQKQCLLRFVIQGYAQRWITKRLGESLVPGEPRRIDTTWLVPVLESSSDLWVTTLRFDSEGTCLSHIDALKDEIAVRRGSKLSPAPKPAKKTEQRLPIRRAVRSDARRAGKPVRRSSKPG
jgi:hypothetical protein